MICEVSFRGAWCEFPFEFLVIVLAMRISKWNFSFVFWLFFGWSPQIELQSNFLDGAPTANREKEKGEDARVKTHAPYTYTPRTMQYGHSAAHMHLYTPCNHYNMFLVQLVH
jgi:hypothetical protein